MFGKWNKKEKVNNDNASIVLKVLGPGCKNCNLQDAEAQAAIDEAGLDARIEHVSDFVEIASFGVMKTPALLVNDKLISSGYVAKKDEIIRKVKELV